MHHPGPPRFVSVGDTINLAPRDPDPSATYRWSIERAPPDSTVTLGDDPVAEFAPDRPGTYEMSLSAPDGVHHMTVRCFPGEGASESRSPERSGSDTGASGLRVAPGESDPDVEDGGKRSYRGPQLTGAEESGEGTGRPRVRLDGHVEGDTVVVEGDPRPHPDADESAADLDVEFVLDDRDGVDASEATVAEHSLRLPIEAMSDRVRVHGVAVGEDGHSVPDAIEVRREGDDIHIVRLHEPPEWSTDAVYYEVYVRTFAPEAPDGEQLNAIADKLDHLDDLGVDAIWLTPVLEHDGAPHGYNITDFFEIAADLGDRSDYRRLVEEAHERDMRVLFDLVLNHSARDHQYFRDAYRNPESEYRDWYEWQPSGEPGTYFDWQHIANFDFDSLAIRRHLIDFVDEWAPLVDGFRCDMAWAVPESFWREVRDRTKDHDPEFLLLDETIPYVPEFHGLFDVHFDSTTYATMRSVGSGWTPAESILDAVAERREIGFPDHAGFLLYAENHDETRYLVECGRPEAFAVAGALCTLPGAPLVYAGQELGQLGQRDGIVWEETDEELTEHYRRLLQLRRSMPALSGDADLRRIRYEVQKGDPDRVVAYGRVDDDAETERVDDGTETPTASEDGDGPSGDASPTESNAAVVVCNFGEEPATVSVDAPIGTVNAATDEDVGTEGDVRVADVAVLPTQSGKLPEQ
jgi:glycosidase